MRWAPSRKVAELPRYLFRELEEQIRLKEKDGGSVVNLAIGDPGERPPEAVVEALRRAVLSSEVHGYSSSQGSEEFREAVRDHFLTRYGVRLDAGGEIASLVGSKEGLGHLGLALLDAGDRAVVPEPAYPVYRASVVLAGGVPVALPLREDSGFLPDPDELAELATPDTKLIYLNYPNNPTGAVAPRDLWERVVEVAARREAVLCCDAAYEEIVFGSEPPFSVLEIEGAVEVAVEFHSFSKTFDMTGWRVGYAVGNREVIDALCRLKSNLDSGVFPAIERAAVRALEVQAEVVEPLVERYRRRKDLVMRRFLELGLDVFEPQGAFYVWAKVPAGSSSGEFCLEVLRQSSVLFAPGSGFGPSGEGWFRVALTQPDEVVAEALERLSGASVWTR